MTRFWDNAYDGLMKLVDDFANCTSTVAESEERSEVASLPSKPVYAYPSDNYFDGLLNNIATKKILEKIASDCYGQQVEEIVNSGSKLTAGNFPRLWSNFEHCCKRLCIEAYPDTYVTNKLTGINGLSVEVNDKKLMLLSFQAAILLNDAEQRFLIGHELGHIQQEHLIAHTLQGLLSDLNERNEVLASIVNDFIEVPLNRWYRESEFTADRAGFLCCQNLDTIKLLFMKLGMIEKSSSYYLYKEMGEGHPMLSTRFAHLIEYANNTELI